MSSPHMRQYDSISFTQYGLAFRIEDGWLDAIYAFDAILKGETLELYPPRQSSHASDQARGFSEMRAKESSLFLVKSDSEKMVKQPTFRTNEVVPQSGIYRVRHKKHRLPHEV